MDLNGAIKFNPRSIKLSKNPTFVVGINPAKPCRNNPTLAWTGPRGASLVQKAALGKKNIYFTNLFNYYVPKSFDKDVKKMLMFAGILTLIKDVRSLKPKKIICLGNFTEEVVRACYLHVPLVKLDHPSYIFRFKKNHQRYIKKLRKFL